MFYESELQFLQDTLHKCHINTYRLNLEVRAQQDGEPSLHHMVVQMESNLPAVREFLRLSQERTIYKITDRFWSNYLMLRLPGEEEYPLLVIGPYLTMELTREQIMEQAEQIRIPANQTRMLENFYAGVPVLTETNMLFSMVDAFCHRVWRDAEIVGVDAEWEMNNLFQPFPVAEHGRKVEDSAWNMRMMEQRYAYENELMQAVSQGSIHKAEMLMSSFSTMAFEPRTSDPVRNLKNYGIIMNTLLRKAAENGGVHPVYLDSVSAGFAKRIEAITSVGAVRELMTEMFRSYCRLVKKNSIKQYSPQVQRTVIQIDSDLGGDLSLKHLAEQQNINASYLSTIFKRETGNTITEYIVQRRMQLARQLLSTTQLQIQTIAQHCGIPDVNYFSKTFKKYVGMTPKQFRQDSQMYAKP